MTRISFDSIGRGLQGYDDELGEVEVVVRAVLSVVDRRIEPGQIERVLHTLAERMRRFWRDIQQDEDIR